jgi:uncharacterized protein (DUF427 family)
MESSAILAAWDGGSLTVHDATQHVDGVRHDVVNVTSVCDDFRPEDVRTDLLSPTDTTSVCPYKGTPRYWTAEVEGKRFGDIVWAYPEPLPEQPRIKDLLCFFNEKVDAPRVEGDPVPMR